MAELFTDEHGGPDRAEANIQVAVRQGRIAFRDVAKWRNTYAVHGYEKTTKMLLDREANPDALRETSTARAAPPTRAERRAAISEAAYREYAYATGIPGYRPQGYGRALGT
jgi:hypothetical protein